MSEATTEPPTLDDKIGKVRDAVIVKGEQRRPYRVRLVGSNGHAGEAKQVGLEVLDEDLVLTEPEVLRLVEVIFKAVQPYHVTFHDGEEV